MRLAHRDGGKICWHRPGRQTRSGSRTCRHCGIWIEYCPCVGDYFRKVDDDCLYCCGSGWVAVVRSAAAMARELLEQEA